MNVGITYYNAVRHQMVVASHIATPLFLLVSHTYGMRSLVCAFIIPAISQPLRGSCMAGYHHLMPTASLSPSITYNNSVRHRVILTLPIAVGHRVLLTLPIAVGHRLLLTVPIAVGHRLLLTVPIDAVRHQMVVASHAATPLGVAKWLVADVRPTKSLPLGRRPIGRHKALHHVFRLVIYTRLGEDVRYFVLKRHTTMMFLLVLDIALDCWHQRFAIRKCAIATLPTKAPMQEIAVNPLGRLYFQRLHQIGNGFPWVHTDEDMDMVSCTIDGMNEMFAVFACPNDIAIEFALPAIVNHSFAMAYGEDNMHVDLCVCISHDLLLFLLVSHTYGMRSLVCAFIIPAISQPLRGSCMAGYHHLMPTASLLPFDAVDAQPSFGADGSQPSFGADGSQPSFDAVGSPPSFDTGDINRLQK